MVVYHSELTVLLCSSDTIAICPVCPKKGDNLHGNASSGSNFCWISLILKDSYTRLLFTFGLIRVNPWFIVFLEHFFRSINMSLFFWAIDKLCGIQRGEIFSTVKCSGKIEYMLVPIMPNHNRSHDNLEISVGAQHPWFPEQQLSLDDLHEIRLGVNYDLGWIHHSIDKHWSLMELRS